jgi:hypothetical protein
VTTGAPRGTTLVKPDTVAALVKRRMVSAIGVSARPPIRETTGLYDGLGVASDDDAGPQVLEHAGALAGVRTVMTLGPDPHAGIFVAANLHLTAFPDAGRAS